MNTSFKKVDNLNLGEILKPYQKNWKLYIFSILVCFLGALVYLRYTTEQYEATAKVQIIPDDNKANELNALKDLSVLAGEASIKMEDEIEILNSRSNFIDLVKDLNLNVKIESVGRITDKELYNSAPFRVSFLSQDTLVNKSSVNFSIRILSDTSFMFLDEGNELNETSVYFGSVLKVDDLEIIITPDRENIENLAGNVYSIKIRPVENIAISLQGKLQVSIQKEYSTIVTLSLRDPVKEKAMDVLDKIVQIYNDKAIQEKKNIADRTSEFINDRIADIYGDLSSADQTAVNFKSSRGITDVSSQANLNLNVGVENQQQLQAAQMQLYMASSMTELIDDQGVFDVLPTNIGLSDNTVSSTVNRYNEMVLERNRLLKSSNLRNPVIMNLDQELNDLKQSLRASLVSMTDNLSIQINTINGQISRINSKIYAAPKNEQALKEIARQQQTTESLYLYLLQKREESQITYASATEKSKIIDKAYLPSPYPVYPKKSFILITSILIGFVIPTVFTYFYQLLDNKLHSKVELEKIMGEDIPVLAELPKLMKGVSWIDQSADRTVLTESLRILRTNLDYLIKSQQSKKGGHVIFVTSSIPSEGKSLTSSSLAMIYAKANKKVLLLGADIRNPMIQNYYSLELNNPDNKKNSSRDFRKPGITDYLLSHDLGIGDLTTQVVQSDFKVDVIHAGKPMPNPSELLMNDRLETLFNELRLKYDYVIVDTAPMLVVSDTQLLTKYADQIVYVTRAGYTEVKVLEFPLKLRKEGKLPNLSFVVNDVKEANLGYGGRKYGYGYAAKTTKRFRFIPFLK